MIDSNSKRFRTCMLICFAFATYLVKSECSLLEFTFGKLKIELVCFILGNIIVGVNKPSCKHVISVKNDFFFHILRYLKQEALL